MELQEEITKIQKRWGEGIVKLGKKEYNEGIEGFLNDFYCFEGRNSPPILFKPTLGAHQPVRTNKAETASYFVGPDTGNDVDSGAGFVFVSTKNGKQPACTSVNFLTRNIMKLGQEGEHHLEFIMVMGRCEFIPTEAKARELGFEATKPVQVDYTFGYRKDSDKLNIFLHHSSHIM